MKTLFAMAAAGTLMLSGAGASAAELPSYELTGFPISCPSSGPTGRIGMIV
jgi:hypothetical protein